MKNKPFYFFQYESEHVMACKKAVSKVWCKESNMSILLAAAILR